jgi:hypothetical protein
MSRVFQNIDPPPPSPAGECVVYPPALVAGGGHTRTAERGVGPGECVPPAFFCCCGGRTHSQGGEGGGGQYSGRRQT